MDNLDLSRQKSETLAKRIVGESVRAVERSGMFTARDIDSSKTAKRVDVVIDYAKGRIAVS